MLEGIDINQRFEYSHPDDKEPKTVFIIKPLSAFEKISMGGTTTIDGDYLVKLLSKCIVEIKNPDILEKQDITSYISGLNNVDAIIGLFNFVANINNVDGELEKN